MHEADYNESQKELSLPTSTGEYVCVYFFEMKATQKEEQHSRRLE